MYNTRMKYLFLSAAVIIGVIAWFQFSTPNLIGNDDVYWHIRYSEQMAHHLSDGRSFFLQPIPYTGFLFHAILGVFAIFFPLILASKLAGIFLAGGVFLVIGLYLESLKVRGAWMWLFMLFLGSTNFSFRILLVRTFLLSLIFLFLGLYFLKRRSKLSVGVVSFLYGLSYAAAPLLIAVIAVQEIITWIYTKKRDFTFIYISIICIALGFMVNPAFPESIGHVLRYVVPVFTGLPLSDLSVGIEMYSYPLGIFAKQEMLILVLWLPALYLSAKSILRRELPSQELTSQIITLGFFILALFARRFIEYWAPFAMVSSAIIYSPYLEKVKMPSFKKLIKTDLFFKFAFIMFVGILTGLGWMNLSTLKSWSQSSERIETYKGVAKWLGENAQPNEIVFNAQWSHYPKLYFWNPNSNYLVKFDPSSLFIDDPELYWKWRRISEDDVEGLSSEEIYNITKVQAQSSYLLMDNSNFRLSEKLRSNNALFSEVYSDSNLSLYRLNHSPAKP